MSDPNQPPRPDGPQDPTPPPAPPSGDPYGGASAGGGTSGQPDYGQAYGQQPGYEQPPGQPAYGLGGEVPGGLLERFLARLIDGILLAIVAGIIEAILAAIFGLSVGGLGVGGSYAYAAVAAVVGTVINLGYFGYLESSRGQTLGKMALKLHVQTMAGALPTLEQAVRRNIWLAFSLVGVVPFVGGLIGALAELVAVIMIAVGISSDSATRRPWTDKYAETRVLKRS